MICSENTKRLTNDHQSEAAKLSPRISELSHTPATQPATQEQLCEVNEEMTGFERSTLRMAWLAFGASILAAIFVGLQWYEMHSSSADTHDLAVAAKTQADGMKDLADRMRDQADQTKSIAEQAIIQAKAAQTYASA